MEHLINVYIAFGSILCFWYLVGFFKSRRKVFAGGDLGELSNHSSDSTVDFIRDGLISISYPKRLRLSEIGRAVVAVSSENSHGLCLANQKSEQRIESQEIEVSSVMSVRLATAKGVEIVGVGAFEQAIVPNRSTEWHFLIRPDRRGRAIVICSISIRFPGKEEMGLDLKPIQKEIEIFETKLRLVQRFLCSEWKWVLGVPAIVIGILKELA